MSEGFCIRIYPSHLGKLRKVESDAREKRRPSEQITYGLFGLYRENGKENGNDYNGVI